MKKLISYAAIAGLILLFSCNPKKKSNEVASYKYDEKKAEMSAELKRKVPDWVVVGKICYGLVVQVDEKRNPVKGKPVKSKVVQINENEIIMKAIETVSLVEVEGCTKMGLNRGDIWEEKDGDFYLTRQDAINALKAKDLYKSGDRVTID